MAESSIHKDIISQISGKLAWHYRIIPRSISPEGLIIQFDRESTSSDLGNELEMITGRKVILSPEEGEIIDDLLHRYYPAQQQDSRQQNAYYHGKPDEFLSSLIGEAKALHSSDIHIETFEEKCRVRVRVDGMLIHRYLLDKKQYPSLINQIKIIANLDIAEKRLPQDGRIMFNHGNQQFDIRVSVLPTLYGEKVVLRLLNNDATNIDIHTLGFSDFDLFNYLDGIRKPNGILLISGPTGSGKTTTLYATLKLLNKETRNILTIEDPIEYTLEGINQVQLKESIGLTFSAALRTFLRQDPDIIMLGEIRDVETANMAIRAALTGHLVLSTIHTNSAWGIVSRLVDMGIAPYLLASTFNTAVAQRLIRLLCSSCKQPLPFDPKAYPRKFKPYKTVHSHFTPKGCEKCFNTGYRGRKAVYEVIPIDEDFAEHIKTMNYNVASLTSQRNIKTLSENAFELFEQGQTSLDEIYSLLMN
ncbi:MAG: type II/IV secretion system protein [Chitinophagaceae bacterium]|nr:type II/IV secretion system protein [Chitinophagaceae bacterium]